ncbi:MAG: O-antigen ligase family protein [Pyrinomonadaceae bacterium]
MLNKYGTPGTTVMFAIGLAIVLLAYWLPYIPNLYTFIHMWRVETFASVLLLTTLGVSLFRSSNESKFAVGKSEFLMIVLPMATLTLWSATSILWAPSWKSAVHHTLVWSLYLIFYFVIRQMLEVGRSYGLLITVCTACFAIIAVPAIVEYAGFIVFGGSTTLGLRYAKYGEPIVTIAPLAVVGAIRMTGRKFIVGVTGVVLLWLLIYVGLGRMNVLLFAAGFFALAATVFIFRHFHRYRRKMLVVAAALVLAPLPFIGLSYIVSNTEASVVGRLAGNEGTQMSNDFRKLMLTLSREMFSANPMIGIGADNFGSEVNQYRARYGKANPDDRNLAAAESDLPERAHNEFLQILVELGAVGGIIFLGFILGVVMLGLKSLRENRYPIHTYAALIGIGMFLLSSTVSSYSFRFVQNGFVLLLVLAVAAKTILKEENSAPFKSFRLSPAFQFCGILICMGLLAYSAVRATSVYFTERANHAATIDEAMPLLERAIALENEDPRPQRIKGLWYVKEARYAEAIPHFKRSIELGLATSTDFFELASAQTLAGDNAGAEATFAEAAELYPQSPFVLTKLAALQKDNGNLNASETNLARARMIDKRQANTWWVFINDGPRKASDIAHANEDYSKVMDLYPNPAIYAVVREREITRPGEMIKLFQ